MAKKISLPEYVEHDPRDVTASDKELPEGRKRGMDTTLLGGEVEAFAPVSNPSIINLDLTTANTEESHSFTANTLKAILRARDLVDLRLAFVSGESGTTYFTLKAGCVLTLTDINFPSTVIYMQSPGTTTVEVLEFYKGV